MFFSSYSLYLSYVLFIIQSLLCKEVFHHPKFYLSNVHFHHPTSTLQRTISSIQVLLKQRSFSSSSLYLSYVLFKIQLVFKLCCFHHPASTLQRTISSSQVLFKQRSFSSSNFYFAKNYFINPGSIKTTLIFIIQLLLCKEFFHQSRLLCQKLLK